MSIFAIMKKTAMKRYWQRFITLESSSSIVLFTAMLLAMLWANSPWQNWHQQFVTSALFVINEGLMAIFFLIVGLELKRGFLSGQLASLSQAALPAVAALGGMIIPALVYCLINWQHPANLPGFTTPVATDIAFALGALAMFGKRVPQGLKLFLLALAIYDDLGAIVLISIFYSQHFSLFWLSLATLPLLILFMLNRYRVQSLSIYLGFGAVLWFCLLQSGIHPTIAGVLLAIMIPAATSSRSHSVLARMEDAVHPWVAFGIMPLFALANAGFSLQGLTQDAVWDHLTLGIILGLFLGKQLGVALFSWCLIRLRWAKLPEQTSWSAFYGVSILCGIGFTMSLFLGTLSFQNQDALLVKVRLGVLLGSLLSGLIGIIVLSFALAPKQAVK